MINAEWHHKMGEENKKLIVDLEACSQESKNNYIQGNLWQNSSNDMVPTLVISMPP